MTFKFRSELPGEVNWLVRKFPNTDVWRKISVPKKAHEGAPLIEPNPIFFCPKLISCLSKTQFYDFPLDWEEKACCFRNKFTVNTSWYGDPELINTIMELSVSYIIPVDMQLNDTERRSV